MKPTENSRPETDIKRSTGKMTLSPLIVVGAVLILLPIFVFVIMQNINRQEGFSTRLLLEKGAALIRSFEAGARAGMMGRGWNNRRLQELLTETARQDDIAYLLLIDDQGRILAHNDVRQIGRKHHPELDPEQVARTNEPQWRFVRAENQEKIFEVFKSYRPSRQMGRMPYGDMMFGPDGRKKPRELGDDDRYQRRMKMHRNMQGRMNMFFKQFGFTIPEFDQREPFVPTIILGFRTQTLEAARADDRKRAIITGVILFFVSAFGIILLFLFYNYRTARSSLSQIKAFSDSMLNQMPIGLVAFNSRCEITTINAFADSLLDLSQAEYDGKPVESILPASLWEPVRELLGKSGFGSDEITCRLTSGKVLPLEIGLSRFSGDVEDSGGFILLLKDLSQVKALEREIMRSQRLASIGRLAAGVAHEIRNPLSSIKGFATYFKERYPDAAQDQKIARIMIEEVERLNRVVGQLLDLARPVQIVVVSTNLKQLLEDSVRLIDQPAVDKGVEIILPESDPGLFSMDGDKIRQVLLNLYLNALDAMPDGGRLTIQAAVQEVDGSLAISVFDTGVGIQPEDIAKIYDPYYTTKQTGTGLGLAVVHNIIEAHHGALTVESTPGKGSIFTLTIPDSTGENYDES